MVLPLGSETTEGYMLELNFVQQLDLFSLQVDTVLPAQGITAIFGLSGAGKTSLINVISGLTRPQYGRVVLNNRVLFDTDKQIYLPPEHRRIGYVFQDARLFPHYSVKGNLRYGMAVTMEDQFDAIVNLLGIQTLLSRFPLMLSGGEKQRVALGRAMLTAPDLLLMDEPLSSLDLPRKRELIPYLERLAQDVNIPILYVSHNMDEILRLAENIVVMDAGKVRASGSIEEIWVGHELRLWLRDQMLSSVLEATVIEHHQNYAMTALALGGQRLLVSQINVDPGHSLRIFINATDISLTLRPATGTTICNILPAKVIEYMDVAGQVDVKLAIGDQRLWARISPWARDELALKQHQWVYAQIKSVSLNREIR